VNSEIAIIYRSVRRITSDRGTVYWLHYYVATMLIILKENSIVSSRIGDTNKFSAVATVYYVVLCLRRAVARRLFLRRMIKYFGVPSHTAAVWLIRILASGGTSLHVGQEFSNKNHDKQIIDPKLKYATLQYVCK